MSYRFYKNFKQQVTFKLTQRHWQSCHSGSILSVDFNQNVEFKTKNVESKIEKCVVHNSICILQEIRYFEP